MTQDQLLAEKRRSAAGRSLREAVNSGNAGFSVPSAPSSVPGTGKVTAKLNLAKANAYKPPTTVLFHDPVNARIRGFYGPKRISRQCNLVYGIDNALRSVLQQM